MQRWLRCGPALWMALLAGTGLAAETPPSEGPNANQVVARVNQVEITYGEFKSRLESFEKERGPIPNEKWGDVLRGMIQEEVILQGAIADRLDKDAAVTARLEEARRRILIEELIRRKVLAQARVTDEEARAMYEKSKPLFSTESGTASRIVVKTQGEGEAIL